MRPWHRVRTQAEQRPPTKMLGKETAWTQPRGVIWTLSMDPVKTHLSRYMGRTFVAEAWSRSQYGLTTQRSTCRQERSYQTRSSNFKQNTSSKGSSGYNKNMIWRNVLCIRMRGSQSVDTFIQDKDSTAMHIDGTSLILQGFQQLCISSTNGDQENFNNEMLSLFLSYDPNLKRCQSWVATKRE